MADISVRGVNPLLIRLRNATERIRTLANGGCYLGIYAGPLDDLLEVLDELLAGVPADEALRSPRDDWKVNGMHGDYTSPI